MLKSISGLAVAGLIALAGGCGAEPAANLQDPSIGVDESMSCVDPSWYCNYIGGVYEGALDCSDGIHRTTTFDHYVQATCNYFLDGNLNVWGFKSVGDENYWGINSITGAGTFPCVVSFSLQTFDWRTSVPFGAVVCRADSRPWYKNCTGYLKSKTTIYNDQLHVVYNGGVCYGAVQCHFGIAGYTYSTTDPVCQ